LIARALTARLLTADRRKRLIYSTGGVPGRYRRTVV